MSLIKGTAEVFKLQNLTDWGSRKISLGDGVGMRLENWRQQTQDPQCSLANQESYLRRQL